MRRISLMLLLGYVCFATSSWAGQFPPPFPPPPPPPPPLGPVAKAPEAGIQWFATLESAKSEAARTGRPMLIISGTPHCSGVSGIW